jgi:hypothetical protein
MSFLIRGALVEYGSNFLGPLPNIVVFQFNPEQLSRTVAIPPPPTRETEDNSRRRTEINRTSGPPTETINLTAHFSAADDLGEGGAVSAIPRVFGIGPQLAAIEKMVYPNAGFISGAIGAAIDAIGDAFGSTGNQGAGRPIPPEENPKILFIWGPTRVLPVKIKSLAITEQKFDYLLNPVQAQVQLGLDILSAPLVGDTVGDGALTYTNTVKEVQATANLAKAAELIVDIIPF